MSRAPRHALWLALVAGCSQAPLALPPADLAMAHSAIEVTLQPNAMIENIARIDILVDGGGGAELKLSTTPKVVPATLPPALTFTMNIPADRTGTVAVTIVVVDGANAQLGRGTASVTLVPLGLVLMTVPIDPIH